MTTLDQEKKMLEKIEQKLSKNSIFTDRMHVSDTSAWITHTPKSFFIKNAKFIEKRLKEFKEFSRR